MTFRSSPRAPGWALSILCLWLLPAQAQERSHVDAAQRGGQLAATDDHRLHVEALWPEQRRLKIVIYDASMQPVTAARSGLSAQVDVSGVAYPIEWRAGDELEARIPSQRLPAEFIVRLRRGDGPELVFRFSFDDYSREVEEASFLLPPTPIPATLGALLASLRNQQQEAERLVRGGSSTMAYVPAVRARDLLLALDGYVAQLPESGRPRAAATVAAAVRSAWLLHVAADVAITSIQTLAAAEELGRTLTDVLDVFGAIAK